jgi:hypothetical protein
MGKNTTLRNRMLAIDAGDITILSEDGGHATNNKRSAIKMPNPNKLKDDITPMAFKH